MDKHTKFWLVVEVVVTFLPLVLLWVILLTILLIEGVTNRKMELPPEQWVTSSLAVLYLLVAGVLGVTGMYAMLVYLLRNGRRILSNRAMLVCAGVGTVTLALVVIPPSESLLGMFGLFPLLCALHILYLGRSYFSANRTMEPTR